jgi:hypothetical protein
MNVTDFIQSYSQVENENLSLTPNLLARAFVPVTFRNLGFNTEIKHENELWKYIDTQHEGRYDENLSLLNEALTADEFELLKEALSICIKFTKSINKELIPRNALSRSLISYRAINSFSKNLNTIPSVLEIGSGSGYLGLLCGISGWRYSSVDVSKSLVTYQNALWNFAGFKVKFAEAGVAYSDSDFLQIPWWVWCNPDLSLLEREILVANHVIQEMTPLSLSHTIKRSKNLGAKYITAEGLGYGTYKNNLNIIDRNTDLIHHNEKNINYQKVWFWKINNVKNSLTESNQFYSNVKSKKRVLIKKLQQWPFFEYLFRKIYYLKARKQLRARGAQLLNKVMVQPHLTIERSLLDDLIRSKGVSFITEDELAMKWAEHRDHL